MPIERYLAVSALKLSVDGALSVEMLKKDTRTSSDTVRNFIRKLKHGGLAYEQGNRFHVNRLMLAIHALKLKADPEDVCIYLTWREFENLAAALIDQTGYRCMRNLRFRHAGRKYQIDVFASNGSIALSVDCKHWQHNLHRSSIKRIVEKQVNRTKALREVEPESLRKLGLVSWDGVKLVPVIMSLMAARSRLFNSVPIVPVFQLADFLDKLPSHTDLIIQL